MTSSVFTKVFGTSNERAVNRIQPVLDQINGFEASMVALTDEQLRCKTGEFRERIAARTADIGGRDERIASEKVVLDELLPEAFALVREASKRAVGMRQFDVQMLGGMVLHQGKISEMQTGEGKTLVATLPCYLGALAGRGVHVITVNDYLAKRDAEWMGKIYNFLGMTVGVIVRDLDDRERRAAYAADITYGTHNEFGFDYLRDNMKVELSELVQRGHYHAIVDEVDSILIDDACAPLILSGSIDQATDKYEAKEGAAIRKEDQTLATISIQNYFRMYKKLSGMTSTAETEASEFDKIYKLDITVIPTNRVMQRVEFADVVYRTAKEKYRAVADEIERLHANKQPVLVGTTSIEKSELLSEILKKKNVRHVVLNAKFHEREAEIMAQAGRLGMVTIATNMAGRGTDILLGGNAESMARQELAKSGRARALGAVEGEIIPVAGPGMFRFYYQSQEYECTLPEWEAGLAQFQENVKREQEQVLEAGGLFIIGTERHESRRLDDQLRGRAGRQGDPGAARFYLSLEDELMRIFARESEHDHDDWAWKTIRRLNWS